jgi:hypothetical protein
MTTEAVEPSEAAGPGVDAPAGRVHPESPEALTDREVDADARALASVVRMRILRLCLDEALTNKQIAERLGVPPANTYHHVQTLARRGFLAAQPERQGARGAREVPYLATGKSWKTPLGPGGGRILIETFLEEVALADPEKVDIARLGLRVGPERQERLRELLHGLFEEIKEWPAEPEGEPLSLFLVVHEDVSRRDPAERR